MFLDAYKRNWLETEGYSFEDKMIDDLSVGPISSMNGKKMYWANTFFYCTSESLGGRGGRGRGDRDEA